MLLNSIGLIFGTAANLGFGFLSWLLAAHLFPTRELGLASGIVSAMMLGNQVALLGIGSAVIALLPRYGSREDVLLDTSFVFVILASTVAAAVFLGLAVTVLHEFNVLASLGFLFLFLLLNVSGTCSLLLDHISTSLRRGDQVLVRSVAGGILKLAMIGVVPLAFGVDDAEALIFCWVVSGLGVWAMGLWQLHRTPLIYRFRVRVQPKVTSEVLRVGLPNHLLTLADRAPGLILPIVATELLSPTANAYWYAAWMMGLLVFIIPISVGLALFAEVSHEPEELMAAVKHSIRTSIVLGGGAAIVLAVLGRIALTFLGKHYAAAGIEPLRVLVTAVLPLTLIQAYYSVCRVTGRLREASITGILSGILSVGLAATLGVSHGLTGMALAWVAAQYVSGAWAAFRLWRVMALRQRAMTRKT